MTQQMNLQKGLVGHWTMNDEDTDGTTLRDSSAYGNDGTIVGSTVTGESSIIGEAYSFDATDSSVDTAKDSGKIRTVAFWFKTDSLGTAFEPYNIWFVTNDGGEQEPRTENDGTPDRLYTRWIIDPVANGDNTGDGGCWSRTGSYDYADGNWHHYASTFDASEINEYFDGELFSQSTGYSGSVPDTTGNFDIRGDVRDYDCSDVRLYNRALSDTEINQLYQMRNEQHHYI